MPAGGSVHARAGEIFLPMQEYLAGMDCPLLNASLVSWRDMFASAEVGTAVAGWMDADFVLTDAGVLIEDGAQAESSRAVNTNK